jgi:hypothetical protein
MLFKDTNQITRNYYLNLFSANADIIKNGNNNFMYEWNIRDLRLGKYADIALVQLASVNADYTAERQYPPKEFNTSTTETTSSGELQNILPITYYKQTITLNTNSINYGYGNYDIYSSSIFSSQYDKKLLFNNNQNEVGGHWQVDNYTLNTGVYNKSNYIVNGYFGDWLILKLPQPILLTRYRIYRSLDTTLNKRAPSEWKVYGSNDGINWEEIIEASQTTRLNDTSYINGLYEKQFNIKKIYIFIGFVFNKLIPDNIYNNVLHFAELQIFGIEILNVKEPFIWYKFDGSSADMLLDSSGNNYHLTNNGATFDATNFKKGYGSSAYNNISSQFLTIPSINLYNIQSKKGITFSLWFRMNTTNTGNYPRIFDFNNGLSTRWIIISRLGIQNKLCFDINNSTNPSGNRITTNDYIDGNWHHIVWSINNVGKWDIYIDGVVASFTAPLPTNINIENITFPTNYFGKSGVNGDGYLSGNIDDFRMYDFVLTSNQAQQLYYGSELTTQNKYIIRSLNCYDDGYDSVNTTSAILFADNQLKSPSNPTYHKLNTYNLNRISLQVSNDIDTNKIYNGWNSNIQFGAIFHIRDYKQD